MIRRVTVLLLLAVISGAAWSGCRASRGCNPPSWQRLPATGIRPQIPSTAGQQPTQQPHPAVVGVSIFGPAGDVTKVTGVCVLVHDGLAEVLTCANGIQPDSRVTICTSTVCAPATVIKCRTERDTALLRVPAPPGIQAIPAAERDAVPGESVWLGGMGWGGGNWRWWRGTMTGGRRGLRDSADLCLSEIEAQCEQGDSGGPILDARGYLIGTISGFLTAQPGARSGGPVVGPTIGRIREALGDAVPGWTAVLPPRTPTASAPEEVLPGPGGPAPAGTWPSEQSGGTAAHGNNPGDSAEPSGVLPEPPLPARDTPTRPAAAPPQTNAPVAPTPRAASPAAGSWTDAIAGAVGPRLAGWLTPLIVGALGAMGIAVPTAGVYMAVRLGLKAGYWLAKRKRAKRAATKAAESAEAAIPEPPVTAGNAAAEARAESLPIEKSQLPPLPVDYAKIWADHVEKNGGSVRQEALKCDLFRRAIDLVRKGEIKVLGDPEHFATTIEKWALDEFYRKCSKQPLPDENIYHHGLLGFLMQSAVDAIKSGRVTLLGGKDNAGAVEDWVHKEFARHMLESKV